MTGAIACRRRMARDRGVVACKRRMARDCGSGISAGCVDDVSQYISIRALVAKVKSTCILPLPLLAARQHIAIVERNTYLLLGVYVEQPFINSIPLS